MNNFEKLLLENKAWAERMVSSDPRYFERMAKSQKPEFLWIGCSDSRVPPNEITGTHSGEVFVHRNIANVIVHTDMNLMGVLQYAVEHLRVGHVIICGHYGCGGVAGALSKSRLGLLNKWLRNVKDVYRHHEDELLALPADGESRVNRLVELNVMEQVRNLSHTSIVQQAWQDRNGPTLHGCVYGLSDGRLKELVTVTPEDPIDEIYRYEFD